MSRVVVVGAGGFLGGALVRSWRPTGRAVVGVARRGPPAGAIDIVTDLSALADHLREGDCVVNAAGVAIKDAPSDVELIRRNLAIAIAVRDACLASGARLVHVSSADIWPVAARAGAREDMEVLPDTAYGLSKLAAENAIAAGVRRGLNGAIVRPTYVYGAGMFEGRIFPAALRQARDGRVVLRGDPDARADYLYIDDLARALALVVDSTVESTVDGARQTPDVVHLGTGTLSTVREVAEAVVRASGTGAPVVVEPAPSPAPPRQTGPVSMDRARALGFVPAFDLEAGCAAFVAAIASRSDRTGEAA